MRKVHFLILALSFLLPFYAEAYDDLTTHPALTQEVISFYNATHSNQELSREKTEWIILGSKEEDVVPRWMNHFYDPILHEGWTGEHAGSLASSTVRSLAKIWVSSQDPISAREWINNREAQGALSRYGGDWTWERGLEAYASGDEENAYIALGHVLHLLEDMAVPDHTRNDTHAPLGIIGDDGSPYEDYAKEWTRENIRKLNILNNLLGNKKSPTQENSIENYLEDVAKYSNTSFFSKDTIKDPKYELPKIINEDENFIYGVNDILLSRVRVAWNFDKKEYEKFFEILNRDAYLPVLDSYFSHLSRYVVLDGAGVIELFLKEGEEYKIKNEFPSNLLKFDFSFLKLPSFSIIGELENLKDRGWILLANILSLFKSESTEVKIADTDLVRDVKPAAINLFKNTKLVSVENDADDDVPDVSKTFRLIGITTSATSETRSTSAPRITNTSSTYKPPQTTDTSVVIPDPNEHSVLMITEIMYDLPGSDSGREWIEVQNIGNSVTYPEELKLIESGTSHKITHSRGSKILREGEYFIIASNISGFLEDNPMFYGNLFESSFSLNNSSEQVEIANHERILSSVTYDSDWGAHGDGFSLQKDNSVWRVALPTPGSAYRYSAPNSTTTTQTVVVVVATSTQPTGNSSAPASSVVISEIQVQGEDSGDEFIELYNPRDNEVDLSGYSIQYVGGSGDVSQGNISKKNFTAGSLIAGHGFFLVAREKDDGGGDGYRGGTTPDITHRAFSLSAGSLGGKIFLVRSQDPISGSGDQNIVDSVGYAGKVPPAGGSIERRAQSNGSCISPLAREAGEFLGHSCDTGTIGDFETRAKSFPQGRKSLPEPRVEPGKPSARPDSNQIGSYRKDLVSIDLLWSPSLDSEGSPATRYEIRDASSSILIATTTALRYRERVWEVGKTRVFKIQAFDRDGLASSPSDVSVDVPGFIDRAEFYKNPKNNQQYLIDFHYSSKDFIPPIYSSMFGYVPRQGMVVYLNRPPDAQASDIATANGVEFSIGLCSGYNTPSRSIIFTTISGNCSPYGGGLNPMTTMLPLEDNMLRAPLAESADVLDLWPDAYVTIGYYDFGQRDGANDGLFLVAVDDRRFPLRSTVPTFSSPVMNGNLAISFDKESGLINLSWERASDKDTPDDEIIYESYKTGIGGIPPSSGWISIGKSTNTKYSVFPNDRKTFHVRARDEMGNVSESISASWEYPEVTTIINQWISNLWSVPLGTAVHSSYSDPQGGSFQSVQFPNSTTIDAVFLKIKRNYGGHGNAEVRLSLYPSGSEGSPDFSARLAESSAFVGETSVDGDDIKFSFSSPLSLLSGVKYWFVLDVLGYENSNGFFSNSIVNALSDGDTYSGGEARSGSAQGAQPDCSKCGLSSIDQPSDWYMKMVDE